MDNAEAYEAYLGRWSRAVASEFVSWLKVRRRAVWLDVACGTGGLTEAILQLGDPERVDACDTSQTRLQYAKARLAGKQVSFFVADGRTIAAGDGTYDAVVAGLPFPSMDEPSRVLAEFARVTKPGGVAAAYVWDLYGEMQILRTFWDSATALDPDADEDDSGERFAICSEAALGAAFRGAGLDAVDVRAIDVAARFSDFDEYWTPFSRGTGPAQSYVQSLGDEKRALLRERLRSALPIAPDGSFTLLVRAWAARGSKAG